jgi:hypothetical protein
MTATLKLPADLNGHGAGMRPPAPAWLVEGTPGAPVLAKTLDEANEAAIQAQDAYRAAILAFREASHRDRDNEWAPLPGVAYERWRDLRNTMDGLRHAAEHGTRHPVEAAWRALRDHLAASDDAKALATRTVEARTATVSAAADKLAPLVDDMLEADALLARPPGQHLATALANATRNYLKPPEPKGWRFVRTDR